jgi:hypothetical protein
VVVEADAILVVEVHHVASVVVVEFDVLLQFSGQAEVLHCEFGGEERSSHVVVAVFDLNEQLWIGDHGLREIALDVRTTGEKSSAATTLLAGEIPAATAAAGVVVDLVFAELQFVVIVRIDQRGVRAANGRTFGIALGVFLEQIERVTAKAGVNSARGEAAATLEFGHELREIHAEIGFAEVVLVKAGEIGEFFRDSGFFRGRKFGAFEKRCGVLALRVLAGFFDEGGQIGGAIFQDFVIPRDGGVAREIVNVGTIIAAGKGDGG